MFVFPFNEFPFYAKEYTAYKMLVIELIWRTQKNTLARPNKLFLLSVWMLIFDKTFLMVVSEIEEMVKLTNQGYTQKYILSTVVEKDVTYSNCTQVYNDTEDASCKLHFCRRQKFMIDI